MHSDAEVWITPPPLLPSFNARNESGKPIALPIKGKKSYTWRSIDFSYTKNLKVIKIYTSGIVKIQGITSNKIFRMASRFQIFLAPKENKWSQK